MEVLPPDQGDPVRGVRLGLTGLVGTAVCVLMGLWLVQSSGSFLAAGATAHLIVAGWVWLAVYLYERRRQRARDEGVEAERLAALAREGRRVLFSQESERTDTEERDAIQRFRRVGFVVFALGVAALELLLAWGLTAFFPREEPTPNLVAAALFCGSAFGLLVLGRYAFALGSGAVGGGLVSAATGGRRATSSALAVLIAGLGTAIHTTWGIHRVDLLGYAFVVLGVLLGLEALLLLLLEAYRPRRPGEEVHPPYDSRLLGILSSPADLARSIARAVDYQFGFALSQTWLYRFMERWVVPLAGFAVVAFWLLSSFAVIQPHEQAVLRRFGQTQDELLEPGFHLKLPWPIDRVVRRPTARSHILSTGHGRSEEDAHEREQGSREWSILWTDTHHADEERQLVLIPRESHAGSDATGAVNLLTVAATVQYQISDLHAYLDGVQDPEALLEVLVERELSFLLSGEDLDLLIRRRGEHGRLLTERLQRAADQHELGITIRNASLTDLHPPVEVGEAFEHITVAEERRKAFVLAAEREEETIRHTTLAEVAELLRKAHGEALTREARAEAQAARFDGLMALDRIAPGASLFRVTRLLEELVAGAEGKRRIILGHPKALQTDLNLQEKITPEALGLGEDPVKQIGDEKDE